MSTSISKGVDGALIRCRVGDAVALPTGANQNLDYYPELDEKLWL